MARRKAFHWAVAALFIFIALPGCTSGPAADAVAKFAQALDTTSTGLQASFAKIEEATYEDDVVERATEYVRGSNVKLGQQRKSPVKAEDLKARLDLIEGLAAYAKLLAVLSDSSLSTKINAGFDASGKSLIGLSGRFKVLDGVDSATVSAGLSAVSAIGNALINWRIQQGLSKAVRDMHPNVVRAGELLTADLGAPPGPDTTGAGLRGILGSQVKTIQFAYADLLEQVRDKGSVNRRDQYALFREVEQKVVAWQNADAALAAVQKALPKMVEAHGKLASGNDEIALDAVRDFLAQAEKIAQALKGLIQ